MRHPRISPYSGAALAEGNAIATGVGLVAPLAVGFSLDLGHGWRPALVVASVLAAAIAATARATHTHVPSSAAAPPAATPPPATPPAVGPPPVGPPPVGPPPVGPPAAGPQAARRPLPRRYWIAWAVVLCCIAAEFATTLWASDVLRHRTGASAALATAALTAVIGGMCAGRIAGAASAARAPGSLLLLPALAVALAGAAVFWFTTSPVVAVAGLAILGLGLGPLYPLAIDVAMQASGGHPDRAAGYASYAAGLAIGSGPFALGALADQVGPHGAFLVVPALFALAATGVLAIRRATSTT